LEVVEGGIVRENYARTDEPGGVIVFDLPGVAAAKHWLTYAEDPKSVAGRY